MATDTPKRILIFSLAYYPFYAGAEVAIREITDRIPPADFEFHLVTLRFDAAWPRYEKVGRVHVHRVGRGRRRAAAAETFSPLFYLSKISFVALAAFKGRALHREHRFDGAWAMMSYMALPLVLMRFMGARIPYALTLQEGDTFERTFGRARIAFFMPLVRLGFRRATVVTVISTYLGTWARRIGYDGPLLLIPNGVDVGRFSEEPSPHELEALRKELRVKQDETLVITTSRLVPKNAVDVLLRALALLPESVVLLIAGEGPQESELRLLAQELGVEKRAHFSGFVPHGKLPLYLHASDIFARPSRSEGMGISFVEAMAAGVPVIATQVGGIADFLFDAEKNPDREPTGFAVGVDAPEDVAEAVRRILADADHARRVAENARALVAQKYEWNTIARDMEEKAFALVMK